MVNKKINNFLPSRIQHHFATVKRYKKTPLKNLTEQYTVQHVAAGRYFDAARRLHADVYLAHHFVTHEDVTTEGYLADDADPHGVHADYFVVIDREHDEVVALARQIHQRAGHKLPVLSKRLAGKHYAHTHADDIVEVSAFAKKPGVDSRVTILLFAEMLRHSKQRGHQYWVFACDTRVYRRLKTLFGVLLQKTGPETFYMGSKVIPAEVNLDLALKQLHRNYRYSVPPLRQVRKFLYESLTSLSNQPTERQKFTSTAFWDNYAKAYDGLLYLAPYRHLVDHVSDLGLASRPKQVLDLGCGTGNVAVALLAKDSTVQVDAVDWSASMLSYLPPKVKDARLTIRRRDAVQYLAETHNTYDVIILNNVVYTINDRARFWKLIAERLNPGGRVIVAHPDTGNSGSLLRDHMSEQSFVSLLRPRLIMIGMFDSAISLLGLSKQYTFTPKDALIVEATASGLKLDGKVGRCYGGHVHGIDLLFTLKKPSSKV